MSAIVETTGSAAAGSTAPPARAAGPRGGVLDLVRADLRDFAGYSSARSFRGAAEVWLNANESPWANAADPDGRVRRYPEPQPPALRAALAALYGCAPEQLLAGRGSDEAIDLLVRALCVPGQGAVAISTPTFGMYAVCARLHGARVVDVPLRERADGFFIDGDALVHAARRQDARLVFACSPGNPTGTQQPLDELRALAAGLAGQAVLVVDEAYGEFAQEASAITLLAELDNVAVLRTLSKLHGLAAARIGCVVAAPALVQVMARCQAPYPLPTPCVELALDALGGPARDALRERVDTTRRERASLAAALAGIRGVRAVVPSQANFLLVRFDDPQRAFDALLAAGIVVRDVRAQPGLGDALRISLGTPAQNSRVIDALAGAMA